MIEQQTFTGKIKYTIIVSEKWVEVGFQGVDPSTDFRGTGRLGYENLQYFVQTYPDKASRLLKIAQDKKTEYFFACAGINVTFFLKKMLKTETNLCVFLSEAKTEEGVLYRFNELFSLIFVKFISYWETHPQNNSFMNFNIVLVKK